LAAALSRGGILLNFRWGIVAGAVAFVISFALGLISGVNIFYLILRAVLFMGIFFVFGVGIQVLINNFMPELLLDENEADQQSTPETPPAGSHVNITLDNSAGYAIPDLYRRPSDDPDAVGNIEDLVSGAFNPGRQPIDQKEEDGYNYQGESSPIGDSFGFSDPAPRAESPIAPSPMRAMPSFAPSFGDDTGDLGGLPDFEAMASVFSSGGSGFDSVGPAESFEGGESPLTEGSRSSRSGKGQPLKGDFNPKELAEGIRTVLSKDK
jgi:hypothetical protein